MEFLQLISTFLSLLSCSNMRYVTNIIHNHEQSDVATVRYLCQHGVGLHGFTSIIQINVQIVPYPSK
jgi:hypothetical protein